MVCGKGEGGQPGGGLLGHQPIIPGLYPGLVSPVFRQTEEPVKHAGICVLSPIIWVLLALQAA